MSLFKNKNFSYLFYATMISNLGSSIFNFIGGWYILEKTGSTLSMGTYLSIPYLVHILFSPFIGVICDRFDRKKIVVITDLINGILMFGIWLVLMMNFGIEKEMFSFFIVNFCICFTDSFANIGTFTLKKDCCLEDEFDKCNSLFAILTNTNAIVGALVSSVLYKFIGMTRCMLLIVVAYLFSCGLENKIKLNKVQNNPKEMNFKAILQEIYEGFIYIKNRNDIKRLFVTAIIFNVTMNPFCSVLLPYLVNENHLDVIILSVWKTAITFGSILCSFYFIKVKAFTVDTFDSFFKVYLVCYICMALGVYSFMNGQIDVGLFIVGMVTICLGMGVIISSFNIPFNTHIHSSVDTNMVGRVYALFNVVSHSFTPLALIVSGYMVGLNIFVFLMITSVIIFIGIILSTRI